MWSWKEYGWQAWPAFARTDICLKTQGWTSSGEISGKGEKRKEERRGYDSAGSRRK